MARRAEEKRGKLLFGENPDRKIREQGVWYALDLCMNQDASLYLDTRNLRTWAKQNLGGKTVLNAFAYTGSLGVAACAGGASRVVQLDLNRQFLNQAKTSYSLNGFPIRKADFLTGDFWPQISRLKRAGERFDCVMLDPPFFSTTSGGVVDLAENSSRLINKVRPLINDGGRLVSVNNALYVSGKAYMEKPGKVVRRWVSENIRADPGAGGFHGLPGDPHWRADNRPGPVQSLDEDSGDGSEAEAIKGTGNMGKREFTTTSRK